MKIKNTNKNGVGLRVPRIGAVAHGEVITVSAAIGESLIAGGHFTKAEDAPKATAKSNKKKADEAEEGSDG